MPLRKEKDVVTGKKHRGRADFTLRCELLAERKKGRANSSFYAQ